MGHVRIKVKVAHPERPDEAVEVPDALVDTGASMSAIPRSIANKLGLRILGQQKARTAAGEVTVDRSYALIEYDGHVSVGDVIITDTYSGLLIGVLTLEGMGLAVDPKSGRLVDSELLLL
jgi:aspartyl protease family protein